MKGVKRIGRRLVLGGGRWRRSATPWAKRSESTKIGNVMKVDDYAEFVWRSDQNRDASVALYGIAGELGSVVSAVKRRLIAKDAAWNVANSEIVEELGDLLWYCFSFAQCLHEEKQIPVLNFLVHDIANLAREIDGDDERAERIGDALGSDNRAEFLERAKEFPNGGSRIRFDEYQRLAFLTARTSGKTLMEVCLAILTQLCAELLRLKLPEIETTLNKNLADRRIEDVLGEIAWHIAAIASLYKLSLDEVVKNNVEKVSLRYGGSEPTPLYDDVDGLSEVEQFPRKLEVCFVSAQSNRLQMYSGGKKLGDPLTDNAHDEDGYRYHDIFHLAFVAKLGWSPVLRALLGRKRKSNPTIDEVEDGARARIVEEAVINAIHAEGVRQAQLRRLPEELSAERLFVTRGEISFELLKLIENFVRNNEVRRSQYWEWVDAIFDACRIFAQLCKEEQGTVSLDLEKRSIAFRPTVYVGLSGQVAVLGSAVWNANSADEADRERLIKQAIFNALAINVTSSEDYALVEVDEKSEAGLAVKAHGRVREAMWEREIIEFRATVSETPDIMMSCTAIGIRDGS